MSVPHVHRRIRSLGVIAASALLLGAVWHPVHVSNTDVELSRDGKLLEITVRIFTDDLEEAMTPSGAAPVRLDRAPKARVDSLLQRYVREQMRIDVPGNDAVRLRLIGHEQRDDATQLYVEAPVTAPPTRLRIEQRVLLARHEDQTNLVHVRIGGTRRSALLRRGQDGADFTF